MIRNSSHRPYVSGRLHSRTHTQRSNVFHEARGELVEDRPLHIDSFGGRADLTCVEKGRPGHARRSHLQIGVFADHKWVLAAQFQVYLLDQ
jgi:hypothetical protein